MWHSSNLKKDRFTERVHTSRILAGLYFKDSKRKLKEDLKEGFKGSLRASTLCLSLLWGNPFLKGTLESKRDFKRGWAPDLRRRGGLRGA